jgi:hypothetical protein
MKLDGSVNTTLVQFQLKFHLDILSNILNTFIKEERS